MKEAYDEFFNKFNIDIADIIEFGINQDTIFPNPELIKDKWKKLIESITNNQVVYIRGYGRDAIGTALYVELYKILLGNSNIKKDPTNNSKPTQLLQKITGYSKTIKIDNSKKIKIKNYQVSHIFGRTKNPFLFTSPWNIVWKSKILDPYTGHETTGENAELYRKAFINKSIIIYSEFIEEYNKLAEKYFNEKSLNEAFDKMKLPVKLTPEKFESFKKDVRNELNKIKE